MTAFHKTFFRPTFFRPLLGAVLALIVVGATADARAQGALREGVNFNIVKPAQPTEAPAGKVEVIEFFGYWCPHCNDFEPTLTDWSKRNEAKVVMVYVPIATAFRSADSNLQKLYYTLEAMGKEKELRRKIFGSIHGDRTLAYDAQPAAMADWAVKNGVDRQKFIDTFNSFTVQSKVSRANQLAAAYGVTAVPTLAFAGKYTASLDARSIGNADLLLGRALTEK